jgi:hypothetical protein
LTSLEIADTEATSVGGAGAESGGGRDVERREAKERERPPLSIVGGRRALSVQRRSMKGLTTAASVQWIPIVQKRPIPRQVHNNRVSGDWFVFM